MSLLNKVDVVILGDQFFRHGTWKYLKEIPTITVIISDTIFRLTTEPPKKVTGMDSFPLERGQRSRLTRDRDTEFCTVAEWVGGGEVEDRLGLPLPHFQIPFESKKDHRL